MTIPTPSITSQQSVQPPTSAPSASDPTTAAAVVSTHGTTDGKPTSQTKIGSMEDLRKKAPDLYKKMLEGIGMNMCNDMQRHNEHLKQLMRESNRH